MRNLELTVSNKMYDTIRNIAYDADQKDAFFVFRPNEIVEKYNQWKNLLPNVQPHYAVNCNSELRVLRNLKALNSSFSCSSRVEVEKLLSMGMNAERIIFSRPTMLSSDFKLAKSYKLTTITFESKADLEKIHKLYPEAKLIICAGPTEYKAEFKFGCSIQEFGDLLQIAQNLRLDVIGIKFHMYPGYRNADIFSKVISTYLDNFINSGFNLNLLDIGDTISDEEDLFNIAAEVRRITDVYECFKNGTAKIIAEPGRFFVASAYTLVCKIDDIRELTNNSNTHRIYHINHDKYGFSCVYSDVPIIPKPLMAHSGRNLYSSSIWGPSDDQENQIVENVTLPEMSMGDWIVFENMGAYTSPERSGLVIFYIDNENNICSDNSLVEVEQFIDNISVPNNISESNMIILSHYSDNTTAGNHRLKYIHLSDVLNF